MAAITSLANRLLSDREIDFLHHLTELHEAWHRGCPLVVSVHNLRDYTGQEFSVDREHSPKFVKIIPVGAVYCAI